ncbi:MAG: hypothetical protein ACR2LK_04785 [Solirubrobacteraceae bacterium]
MPWINNNDRPHPAFAEPFRAYANYLEVIAEYIGRRFGRGAALLDGVHAAVLAHPPLHRVQRRPLQPGAAADFEAGLRKGWGFLRRVQREVSDELFFDEEANALLPYSTWYAVHHVGRAFAAAARQTVPRDHLALLHALGRTAVTRGLFPLPWAAWCGGCPQTGTHAFGGLESVGAIHVLSRPTPDSFEDRLALVLRTTRERDLSRSFDGLRQRKVAPGRTRRNLTRTEKDHYAKTFAPTTLFDFLYRLRLAASYGEADVFVLGSRDENDARQLAVSLAVICDATVAALEALIAAYAGPEVLARAADGYSERTGSTLVRHRAEAWRCRVGGAPAVPARRSAFDEDIPF